MVVVLGSRGGKCYEAGGLVGLVQTGGAVIGCEQVATGGVGEPSLCQECGGKAARGGLHGPLLASREVKPSGEEGGVTLYTNVSLLMP